MTPEEASLLAAVGHRFESLLSGRAAATVESSSELDPDIQVFCGKVNDFIAAFNEAQTFIKALAEGDLDSEPPPRCLLASPYKQLHANLKHLTWQARRIAEGDYTQRVHFMGDFATAFNAMVEALDEKRRVEESLRTTQKQIKQLEGIIPICMFCKKIRNDTDLWLQVERYVSEHSAAQFSHSICPACMAEHYGEELGPESPLLKRGAKLKKA